MGGGEMKYVKEAFDSNWIAPLGPNVDAFERELCAATGAKHVAALSSGTAAIHLSLILLGVKPGDYVIGTSFTFSATVNPIAYLGATPVLVDSDPLTWNMDVAKLQEKIENEIEQKGNKRLKAIMVVHIYGLPVNMEPVLELAERFGLKIIEDAAEMHGQTYCGRPCGSFGNLSTFSFFGYTRTNKYNSCPFSVF